jgi:hypothetical protein
MKSQCAAAWEMRHERRRRCGDARRANRDTGSGAGRRPPDIEEWHEVAVLSARRLVVTIAARDRGMAAARLVYDCLLKFNHNRQEPWEYRACSGLVSHSATQIHLLPDFDLPVVRTAPPFRYNRMQVDGA